MDLFMNLLSLIYKKRADDIRKFETEATSFMNFKIGLGLDVVIESHCGL